MNEKGSRASAPPEPLSDSELAGEVIPTTRPSDSALIATPAVQGSTRESRSLSPAMMPSAAVYEVMPSNLPPAPSILPPPPSPVIEGPMAGVVALIEQNEWSKVCDQLRPMREALPATSPALGLFYAIARHEDALSRQGTPARDPANEELARESLALLLEIGRDTAAARMLTLRLLRRPWSAAPAPGARTSFFIVLIAIAVGAMVGWMIDQGMDRLNRHPPAGLTRPARIDRAPPRSPRPPSAQGSAAH